MEEALPQLGTEDWGWVTEGPSVWDETRGRCCKVSVAPGCLACCSLRWIPWKSESLDGKPQDCSAKSVSGAQRTEGTHWVSS